jgi:hypothetical protein
MSRVSASIEIGPRGLSHFGPFIATITASLSVLPPPNAKRSAGLPHARARERVVPISELVFGALTQNQSSLEPSLGFAATAGTPRIETGGTFAVDFVDGRRDRHNIDVRPDAPQPFGGPASALQGPVRIVHGTRVIASLRVNS